MNTRKIACLKRNKTLIFPIPMDPRHYGKKTRLEKGKSAKTPDKKYAPYNKLQTTCYNLKYYSPYLRNR